MIFVLRLFFFFFLSLSPFRVSRAFPLFLLFSLLAIAHARTRGLLPTVDRIIGCSLYVSVCRYYYPDLR